MNKLEFNKLYLKDKAKLVLIEKGKFIASRDYYNQRLVLYDMVEFFAEVWYEPEGNKINNIISIELDDKRINGYIDSLSQQKIRS
jgi:hypothetical protein